MPKQFRGKSEDVDCPFLGAEFWQPGTKIAGKVLRVFQSENGPCYALQLTKPAELEGETFDEVALGSLTGLKMALQAAALPDGLQPGDMIHLECTGLKSTTKGSPRPNFEIEVNRP